MYHWIFVMYSQIFHENKKEITPKITKFRLTIMKCRNFVVDFLKDEIKLHENFRRNFAYASSGRA